PAPYRAKQDETARGHEEAGERARATAAVGGEPVRQAPVPAYQDAYRTPIVKDPFSVPIKEKLELLRAVAEEARKVDGIFSTRGFIAQRIEHRFFSSTDGSVIEQHVFQIAPEFDVSAVDKGRKQKGRTYRPHPVTAGYEAVERAHMLAQRRRVAEEAVAHI